MFSGWRWGESIEGNPMMRSCAFLTACCLLTSPADAGEYEMVGKHQVAVCNIAEESGGAPSCRERPKSHLERDRMDRLSIYEKALLSGARFSAEGGRTNEAGFTEDGVSIPVRFDDEINTWKIQVGYVSKPIVADLVNVTAGVLGNKALPRIDHRAIRELVIDPVKLDLTYGYGRTAKALVDDGRRIDRRTAFRANVKYELPLDKLWAHTRDVLSD